MELILKSAAASIAAAFACLLIKKTNPEISFALTVFTAAAVMVAAMSFLDCFSELVRVVRQLSGAPDRYIVPVVKCAAIGITTKLCSELCRDASQNSVAVSLEMAGAVCALAVSMPLILSMLNMLESLI